MKSDNALHVMTLFNFSFIIFERETQFTPELTVNSKKKNYYFQVYFLLKYTEPSPRNSIVIYPYAREFITMLGLSCIILFKKQKQYNYIRWETM